MIGGHLVEAGPAAAHAEIEQRGSPHGGEFGQALGEVGVARDIESRIDVLAREAGEDAGALAVPVEARRVVDREGHLDRLGHRLGDEQLALVGRDRQVDADVGSDLR